MITDLTIRGFKSLKDVQSLPLGPVNLLIGANSAGKSNLVDVFRLLGYMFDRAGNLQGFVSWRGYADNLLFDGAQTTDTIELELGLEEKGKPYRYRCRLGSGAPDTLYFASEECQVPSRSTTLHWFPLGYNNKESQITTQSNSQSSIKTLLSLLRDIKVYQFHNTSSVSKMRRHQSVSDNVYLREDGSNLPSTLYRFSNTHKKHFQVIERTLRLAFPQFLYYVLQPEDMNIQIRWREEGSEQVFGAHQASDGTLRLMALLFLLLQPREERPKTMILDEPELGLHPAAIRLIAELVKAAARGGTQVILATQSAPLLNAFAPEDVAVVERIGRATTVRRLDAADLGDWLKDYTLADLWDMNVLGGRPR
jgi:predicted ATPase